MRSYNAVPDIVRGMSIQASNYMAGSVHGYMGLSKRDREQKESQHFRALQFIESLISADLEINALHSKLEGYISWKERKKTKAMLQAAYKKRAVALYGCLDIRRDVIHDTNFLHVEVFRHTPPTMWNRFKDLVFATLGKGEWRCILHSGDPTPWSSYDDARQCALEYGGWIQRK